MREIKCEICGKIFMSPYPNKKYCSNECRNIADRIRRRKWNTDHPEYMSDYYRERKEKIEQLKRESVNTY